jgi:NTP pyrophosphatase (non-canonical NTP hydrolase)
MNTSKIRKLFDITDAYIQHPTSEDAQFLLDLKTELLGLMTPNEYQQLALRTEKTPPFVRLSGEQLESFAPCSIEGAELRVARLIHGLVGACTEVGEAQDAIKKFLIYGKKLDLVNVLEEAGDKLWYIALALDAAGYTIEDAMKRNIAKLRARYGDKFSVEKALNRDLLAERRLLEGGTQHGEDCAADRAPGCIPPPGPCNCRLSLK